MLGELRMVQRQQLFRLRKTVKLVSTYNRGNIVTPANSVKTVIFYAQIADNSIKSLSKAAVPSQHFLCMKANSFEKLNAPSSPTAISLFFFLRGQCPSCGDSDAQFRLTPSPRAPVRTFSNHIKFYSASNLFSKLIAQRHNISMHLPLRLRPSRNQSLKALVIQWCRNPYCLMQQIVPDFWRFTQAQQPVP